MKTYFSILVICAVFVACAPDKPLENDGGTGGKASDNPVASNVDPTKGLGQVKNVTLNTPLEQDRVKRGQAIFEMKCSACHKLTDQRVVGPGWAGVTKRRQPEWIMNMITNVDLMLEKDPEAQKLLELCLVRMPNQNVSIGDARDILEFMRQNDGEK
ncbi:MAG TPA: c-type cytochrome [Chryseosolibacter sp.]|nr:c-type cytochrome [Chryseosolibacter sp.]